MHGGGAPPGRGPSSREKGPAGSLRRRRVPASQGAGSAVLGLGRRGAGALGEEGKVHCWGGGVSGSFRKGPEPTRGGLGAGTVRDSPALALGCMPGLTKLGSAGRRRAGDLAPVEQSRAQQLGRGDQNRRPIGDALPRPSQERSEPEALNALHRVPEPLCRPGRFRGSQMGGAVDGKGPPSKCVPLGPSPPRAGAEPPPPPPPPRAGSILIPRTGLGGPGPRNLISASGYHGNDTPSAFGLYLF